MLKRIVLTAFIASLVPPVCWATEPGLPDFPAILSIRDRAELVLQISQKRLEQLLARFMRKTGFDMWIITCNEDNPDPVFEEMTPYKNWCPITQIIVFFDLGPEEGESVGLPGQDRPRAGPSENWDQRRRDPVGSRGPKDIERYGKDDKVIRPGDFIHCDVGLKYMRYTSERQEWA